MTYPDAESLMSAYATNHWLIGRLTEGLSHEDSLVQPPYQGNCLNWVVGHIIAGRHTSLKLLGAQTVWSDEQAGRYKTGSPPVTGDENAIPFDRLLNDLDLSQERIAAALDGISPEVLATEGETDRGIKPVAEHLDGLHWHETYHTGQLELLRAMVKSQ